MASLLKTREAVRLVDTAAALDTSHVLTRVIDDLTVLPGNSQPLDMHPFGAIAHTIYGHAQFAKNVPGMPVDDRTAP